MPAVELQLQTRRLEFWLEEPRLKAKVCQDVKSSACSPTSLHQRALVLHELWGVGRVIGTGAGANTETIVCFADGHRTVPSGSLRHLLPRTKVAELIERSTPNVSAWMVRKADKQGTIEPDLKGRFAGHAVHYYHAARIPLLINELSKKDPWSIGTLVVHSEHGAGSVVGLSADSIRGTEQNLRLVQFFATSSPVLVSFHQLRYLVASSTVAKRLGVNRKTFRKLAKSRGVYPSYVHSEGLSREFYDEAQIESIQRRWSVCEKMDYFARGSLVIDRQGEIARVESNSPSGMLQVCYLGSDGSLACLDPKRINRLVSLRALARQEQMSRYKLNRLLTSARIRPVYQDLSTSYWDASVAGQALHAQSRREATAISLAELSESVGISPNVLAGKARQGCIHTIGGAAYAVNLCEAERIKDVVRALQSQTDNLQTLGICKLQPRGRAGQEVVAWNIDQLISVALSLTVLQKVALFEQVAWLCTGAGHKRLIESLKSYLLSSYSRPKSEAELTRGARVLITLVQRLPEEFAQYHNQLTLVASMASQLYSTTAKV
jgi:hypothetical protein